MLWLFCLTDGQRARWPAFGARVRCVGSEHGAGLPRAGPCHYAVYLLWLESLRSASLRKCLLLTTFKNKFFRHNRSLGEGKSPQAGICLRIEDLQPWAPWGLVCSILQVVPILAPPTDPGPSSPEVPRTTGVERGPRKETSQPVY